MSTIFKIVTVVSKKFHTLISGLIVKMHSASDIFCLKELKEGDTSGTQLFSVNGSSQLTTLGRRKYFHNESCTFQYGSTDAEQNNLHKLVDRSKNIEDKDELKADSESPSHSSDQLKLLKSNESDPVAVSEETENDLTVHNSNPSDIDSKIALSHAESDMKEGIKVSKSAMARNPLTGAGMDAASH